MKTYISNLEIIYSWHSGQRDLDTVTTFLGQSVGFGFVDGDIPPYIQFNSDNVEEGPEIVIIDLPQAYLDGQIGDSVSIDCHADWFPPANGSGSATITWIYAGQEYSNTIYPNIISHAGQTFGTLVKTIEISASDLQPPLPPPTPYVYPYDGNNIYEFDPIFNLNTGDLSITADGYALHKSKDVSFFFDVTDRQLNVLNSADSLIENPFIKSVDIDILDISGIPVYYSYIRDSFQNTFTLTEQENINIFGAYTKDFGIGISTIGENANIHSSRYFVYSNPLEIQSISITDSTGVWLNNNPIQYQNYVPYETYATDINCQYIEQPYLTPNALYFDQYKDYVSGYSAMISGLVPFAIFDSESLKIDWGDGSQVDKIFYYDESGDFLSISGVSFFNTDPNDVLLSSFPYINVDNGLTYGFVTGHNYPTGVTGIYDVKFYYSGSGATGQELIKTIQYRIPDELKDQGKPQIGDPVTGKINFNIQLYNNAIYTNFDKLEIYASTDSGVSITSGNLNKTIPILSNTQNYSFYLNDNNLLTNTPYWFNVVPYGQVASGYGWQIGPYSIYQAPSPKTNISSQSFSLLNGDSEADIDFLTGLVETNYTTTIDTLPKGSKYSYEYLTQFKDESGCYCSSKILIVDNTSGMDTLRTGLSFTEYSISDNSFVNYSISGDDQNIYLNAQLDTPTGIYKLYRTSI